MTHRIRLTPPPILPPRLSEEQRVDCLHTRLHWTPCQAKVVLAGIGDLTCQEIGHRLGMAEGTVKVHYGHVFAKVGCGTRHYATALAVAVLWQVALGG